MKIKKTKQKSTVSTSRSSTAGAKGVKRSTEKVYACTLYDGFIDHPLLFQLISTKNQYELKCLAKRKTAERVKKAMFDKVSGD